MIDDPALQSHGCIVVHCEQAKVQRIAECKAIERAQVALQSAAKYVFAVVFDARIAQGVAHRPGFIDAMLKQAARGPLIAMKEIVARLAGECVPRDSSIWIGDERALRGQELTPPSVISLVIAEDRPGCLR